MGRCGAKAAALLASSKQVAVVEVNRTMLLRKYLEEEYDGITDNNEGFLWTRLPGCSSKEPSTKQKINHKEITLLN
jgi:hypothetical protein